MMVINGELRMVSCELETVVGEAQMYTFLLFHFATFLLCLVIPHGETTERSGAA